MSDNGLNGWTPIAEMPEEWKRNYNVFLICGGVFSEAGYSSPQDNSFEEVRTALYIVDDEISEYLAKGSYDHYEGFNFVNDMFWSQFDDATWYKPEFVRLLVEKPDCLKNKDSQ